MINEVLIALGIIAGSFTLCGFMVWVSFKMDNVL